jgi:hypothetical protein
VIFAVLERRSPATTTVVVAARECVRAVAYSVLNSIYDAVDTANAAREF